jgi:Gpi18-like mannosyltransferase
MSLHALIEYFKKPQRWAIGLIIVATVYHLSVILHVQSSLGLLWKDAFNHWDSGWYTDIIRNGYNEQNFAFYPLYPLIILSLTKCLPDFISPEMIGAATSTCMFLLYGFLVSHLLAKPLVQNRTANFLLPHSTLAWFFMLWSPASYIFQTHHTEATFLLLSLAAFISCENRHFLIGSIFAGLCSVTKNQGIFVAVSVGFWWAYSSAGWGRRCRNFAISGLVSGAFFAAFLWYSFLKTNDFTAFYSAQSHWRPEMNWTSYFKALWFGNSWQNTNIGSLERYILFWLLVAASIGIWKKHKPLGLYVALFVGVMPLSGEFVGTYRYSSVLWPVWFWFAEQIDKCPHRLKKIIIPTAVLGLLYINHQLTRYYALGRWAY